MNALSTHTRLLLNNDIIFHCDINQYEVNKDFFFLDKH